MLRAMNARPKRSSLPWLVMGIAALWAIGVHAETGLYPDAESVQPLQAGAQVPSAVVHEVDGDPVDLADLASEKGMLLVFYRGGW